MVVTKNDLMAKAEKQIACALLCGCPVIIAADQSHKASLKTLQANYLQAGLAADLLQIEPIESLSGLIQDSSVEGLIANSLNYR